MADFTLFSRSFSLVKQGVSKFHFFIRSISRANLGCLQGSEYHMPNFRIFEIFLACAISLLNLTISELRIFLYEKINFVLFTRVIAHFVDILMQINFNKEIYALKCCLHIEKSHRLVQNWTFLQEMWIIEHKNICKINTVAH